jgi:uncharacterized protein YjbJ (UPF0337 family)
MNWDRIQSNWSQYKSNLRENFSKLTEDDIEKINGRRDQFLGKLQERYGYSRDVAEQKLTDFTATMGGAAGMGATPRERPHTPRKSDKS